ncbi:hypothetical protein AN478_10970 [Thiohalorhabdus denitrificans]|uniref:Ubiquinone/menaquinone biosynthesis C-methylase UbiE n=1 Tax=Thiohalorhabdus denitrificans TaxID=381306 RepID=A0A0P9CKX9_9GAMM|nr:class I SAM-dependent methyltransferase [Thiohalorhabdus denitrificans]KPV39640.1 hypothetical protein AN478_10970 [Thiohalorhabdus denitrificans]SCX95894.1 Ubiquinone/menaquinone biosynthesis C-methylase UbiE [Thiohalorhabdus denitrificans]
MRNRLDPVRRRYDRLAPVYEWFEGPMEVLAMAAWRQDLVARVQGPAVLEAGVGTGKNLPLYGSGLTITAVDLSSRMLERSRRKPVRSPVQRLVMDVEHLGFPDNTFDEVLATFLFCSVSNPVRGLCELARVVRPGGRVLLLEHVRPGGPLLGPLFDRLNPLVLHTIGPNINRDTVGNIREAGLMVEEETDLFRDIVKRLVCRVP